MITAPKPCLGLVLVVLVAIVCGTLSFAGRVIAKGKPGGGGNGGPFNPALVSVTESGLFLLTIGGEEQRLTRPNGKARDVRAVWSPDGSLIAFKRHPDHEYVDQDIYTIRPDGSGERLIRSFRFGIDPIPDTFNHNLVWTPDGSRLVFSSGGGIYALEPDGTLQLVVDITNRINNGRIWLQGVGISFSPDLDTAAGYQGCLAFAASIQGDLSDPPGTIWMSDVFVLDVNIDEAGTLSTGGLDNLTNTPGEFEDRPVWHPEGNHILFQRLNSDWDYDAVLYDFDAGTESTVETIQSNVARFAWSPDGNYLAFDDRTGAVREGIGTIYYSSPWDPSSMSAFVAGDGYAFPNWNPVWKDDITP